MFIVYTAVQKAHQGMVAIVLFILWGVLFLLFLYMNLYTIFVMSVFFGNSRIRGILGFVLITELNAFPRFLTSY